MATAPRVGQNNEKTMTREQRTMTWIGRTKTENKEKSEKSNSQHDRMSTPVVARVVGGEGAAVGALPWQHLNILTGGSRDCETARLQEPRTACLTTKQI